MRWYGCSITLSQNTAVKSLFTCLLSVLHGKPFCQVGNSSHKFGWFNWLGQVDLKTGAQHPHTTFHSGIGGKRSSRDCAALFRW
jgi:hypothetical protein